MKKNVISVVIFAVLIYGISALCIFAPKDEYSESERRVLAKLPDFSKETLLNGDFAKGFEEYATDNFPMRDTMRSLKAYFATNALGKADNNGLFTADGHISKIDEPIDYAMLDIASDKLRKIVNNIVKDDSTKVYFSIVPDKNMYLANKNGYPSINYTEFIEEMKDRTEFMEYIDITHLLDANDYYYTDTHWRQEKIGDVAEHIASSMGSDIEAVYDVNTLDTPFNGVYVGQYAMKTEPDTIRYLTNDTIQNAVVSYCDDNGMFRRGDMYNMDKAKGHDAYEMFLSGSMPLVTIENPDANTDKELIMFRDSYGSSLAPFFVQGYKKITLADIRYMESGMLGGLLNTDNADVLFIYSTSLLNKSTALR